MATIFMATADLNDLSLFTGDQTSISTSTTYARTGSRSYRLINHSLRGLQANFNSISEIYGRVAVLVNTNDFLRIWFGGSNNQMRLDISDTTLRVVNRTATNTYNIIELIYLPLVGINIWNVIEFYIKIHLTEGQVIIKINGNTEITLNNVRTQFDSTSINNVYFMGNSTSQSQYFYIDDIVFDDANWPGLGGIEVLRPDANGFHQGWDAGGFADVNADNDATYVATDAAVAAKDSFELPAPAAAPARVGLWAKSQLSGAGAGTLRPFFRTSGSDTPGDSLALSTSLAWQAQYGTAMPDEVGLEVVI